ncbi:ATP-binding protein [Streptomyces sp. NBC_01235]|uniref:ATP-binding protein n=1 Tax=Streptomyces sp. NBC_01235 TaxID=2903788 RepID=UPI002E0DDC4A|nr:ATP-binding protein [Streptomyces sp. NBC_01235]
MQVLQVQLEIRPDPAEVGRARRWARSRLAGSGIGDEEPLAETLILLVSELVTNAVVHTGCPAVLRLSLPGGVADGSAEPSVVRLEVADTSDRAPVPRCAGDEATGGRGLALVDGLADRWGWSVEGAGKRIWCELDRCAEPGKAAVGHGGAVECGTAAQCDGVAVRESAYQGFEGFAFEVV